MFLKIHQYNFFLTLTVNTTFKDSLEELFKSRSLWTRLRATRLQSWRAGVTAWTTLENCMWFVTAPKNPWKELLLGSKTWRCFWTNEPSVECRLRTCLVCPNVAMVVVPDETVQRKVETMTWLIKSAPRAGMHTAWLEKWTGWTKTPELRDLRHWTNTTSISNRKMHGAHRGHNDTPTLWATVRIVEVLLQLAWRDMVLECSL